MDDQTRPCKGTKCVNWLLLYRVETSSVLRFRIQHYWDCIYLVNSLRAPLTCFVRQVSHRDVTSTYLELSLVELPLNLHAQLLNWIRMSIYKLQIHLATYVCSVLSWVSGNQIYLQFKFSRCASTVRWLKCLILERPEFFIVTVISPECPLVSVLSEPRTFFVLEDAPRPNEWAFVLNHWWPIRMYKQGCIIK